LYITPPKRLREFLLDEEDERESIRRQLPYEASDTDPFLSEEEDLERPITQLTSMETEPTGELYSDPRSYNEKAVNFLQTNGPQYGPRLPNGSFYSPKAKRIYRKRKRRTYRRTPYKRRRTGSSRAPRNAVVYPNIVGLGGYGLRKNYGRELGGMLGEGVQGLASALGFGGYAVKSNSLMDMIDLGQSPPAVKNSRNGEATIFQHREYVKDLYTPPNPGGGVLPTPFSIETFNINPGNSALFPFLGPIAQNFQTYEIRGMLIELKTLSSEFSTQMAMGSMFVATEYNTYKTPPTDKRSLENMEYAMSCKPSGSCLAPIECAPMNSVQTHLYVVPDNNYGGGDERLSDLGQIYIGTQGCPGWSQPVAEIWVTYEIALYKPLLNSGLNSNQTAHYQLQNIGSLLPFGTTRIAGVGSNPGVVVSATQIDFPLVTARWYVSYSCWGTGASGVTDLPDLSVGFGASVVALFSSNTGNNTFTYSSDEGNNLSPKFAYNTIVSVSPVAGGTDKPFLRWGTNGVLPQNAFGDLHIIPYGMQIKS